MAPRLAAVYAHPDDDTFGIGGLLSASAGDLAYTVIVATSGEAGMIADPALATPETLGGVREQEERAALRTLGVNDPEVHFLRFPDGGLDGVDRMDLVARIADVLAEARPHVVVTFGPEGVTRHPDHVAVGQAATEAFHRLHAQDAGGAFRRLFYNAVPESSVKRFWDAVRRTGLDFGEPDDPFMPRGVPDHTITVRVDCREVFGRKLAAIREHRTQSQELDVIPTDVREELFAEECFVQAWPPVTDPAGPVAISLFEGLGD